MRDERHRHFRIKPKRPPQHILDASLSLTVFYTEYLKENEFIHVISMVSKSVDLSNDPKCVKVINLYLDKYGNSEADDNEVINYGSWLNDLNNRLNLNLNT